MQSKVRNISGAQLVMLLFVSRIFSLMTYVPKETAVPGSTALLTIPLAALVTIPIILPFLWMSKKCAADPLTAAFRVGRGYGIGVSILFFLFCSYMSITSVTQFAFFMTSTAYQNVQPWIFLIGLTAVAAYGAYLGLEAFSRMGMLVFFLVLAMLLTLTLVLLPELKPVYLTNPLMEGVGAVAQGTLGAFSANAELVLFMLLAGRTSGRRGRTFGIWLAASAAAFELVSAVVLLALGDYVKTRLFPMHTAMSLAQISAFGRLDLFHIIVWVLAAFLRATLYLYGANLCLRRIFPMLPFAGSVTLCACLAGGVSLFAASGTWFRTLEHIAFAGGIPLILLVLLFPLVTLLFPKAHKPDL